MTCQQGLTMSDDNTLTTDNANINQDGEPVAKQQVSNESVLDMMKGLHEHEQHEDLDQESSLLD